jgi:hypothetical protein
MKISELPEEVKLKALYNKNKDDDKRDTDDLGDAFFWDDTEEGYQYWEQWDDKEIDFKAPTHYNNSKGSLYQFCEEQDLNTYEFDIIKRVMRCRKKGMFIEDLEKTKFLIDLYIKEMKE